MYPMKKKILIGVSAVLVLLIGFFLYAALVVAKRSPKTETAFNEQGLEIKVSYCQPYKKGRVIFGEEKDGALQPYGKYWRLGANAATEITFNKNVTFAGKPVNAGTYRMYAVPGPESFKIALNSETGVYFAINEPKYDLDVVKVNVPVTDAPETEQFTIAFAKSDAGSDMNLVWDKTKVTVPISAQ
jgi:hypothetical protein